MNHKKNYHVHHVVRGTCILRPVINRTQLVTVRKHVIRAVCKVKDTVTFKENIAVITSFECANFAWKKRTPELEKTSEEVAREVK